MLYKSESIAGVSLLIPDTRLLANKISRDVRDLKKDIHITPYGVTFITSLNVVIGRNELTLN